MVGKAKADIATIEQAVEMYRLDNLDFPTDLQALVAAPAGLANPERYRQGGYIRRLPDDPWGNPYRYRRPARTAAVRRLVARRGRQGRRRGQRRRYRQLAVLKIADAGAASPWSS